VIIVPPIPIDLGDWLSLHEGGRPFVVLKVISSAKYGTYYHLGGLLWAYPENICEVRKSNGRTWRRDGVPQTREECTGGR
jgi:hypothetical protein